MIVLAFACRLYPLAFNNFATVVGDTRCPVATSSPASFVVDFVVHRNDDSGSPRVTGSTNASSASHSVGSAAPAAGRPAPGRRTRPGKASGAYMNGSV